MLQQKRLRNNCVMHGRCLTGISIGRVLWTTIARELQAMRVTRLRITCDTGCMARLSRIRKRRFTPLRDARLIVGLGNPGAEYTQHRHNAGLRAAEHVRRRLELPTPAREPRYRIAQGETPFGPVAVALPRVFMNESGRAVQSLLDAYRAEPAALVLLVDELDLEPGRIRIRPSGSDAGQRGMRSIRAVIGGLDFPRIRIGVGRPIIDGAPSRHPRSCGGLAAE